jgi:hypothetical protein
MEAQQEQNAGQPRPRDTRRAENRRFEPPRLQPEGDGGESSLERPAGAAGGSIVIPTVDIREKNGKKISDISRQATGKAKSNQSR